MTRLMRWFAQLIPYDSGIRTCNSLKRLSLLSLLLIPSLAFAQPTVRVVGSAGQTTVPTQDQAQSYNHWELKATNIQNVTIPGGGQYLGGFAIPCMDYKEAIILVSYAAADSDSIALEIKPIAKESVTDDGLYFTLDTDPSTSQIDGYLIESSAALINISSNVCSYIIQSKLIAQSSGNGFLRAVLGVGNQVAIPFGNKQGVRWQLPPYLKFWVINRSPSNRSFSNVSFDLWVKT